MSLPSERRKSVRLNVALEVFTKKKSQASAGVLSLTKNISNGGICFVNYGDARDIKEVEVLHLKIFLPEYETPISAAGKVAWIKELTSAESAKGRGFNVGIEFTEISEEDKKKIEAYISSRLSK